MCMCCRTNSATTVLLAPSVADRRTNSLSYLMLKLLLAGSTCAAVI